LLKRKELGVHSFRALLNKEQKECALGHWSLQPSAMWGYATLTGSERAVVAAPHTPGVFALSVRKRLKNKKITKLRDPSVRKCIEGKDLGNYLGGRKDSRMPEGLLEAVRKSSLGGRDVLVTVLPESGLLESGIRAIQR
jgi:hypothetical protein